MQREQTFVMIKPDGVERGLVGDVLRRFEGRGLQLRALNLMEVSRGLAEEHYGVHADKPFYPALIEYITSGPVVASVWEGPNAVEAVRATMGATNPAEAAPGTIRGDYCLHIDHNLVHGSDAPETAEREIALFFPGEKG